MMAKTEKTVEYCMWNLKRSATISIVVCGVMAVALVALTATAPWAFRWYMMAIWGVRENSALLAHMTKVFLWCYYPCAVCASGMLAALLKLLFNVRREQVFIKTNVVCLKLVSWWCILIAAIAVAGACFYMPFSFVAVAGAFVGVMLRVLSSVMQAAVVLREENDLTI